MIREVVEIEFLDAVFRELKGSTGEVKDNIPRLLQTSDEGVEEEHTLPNSRVPI